MTNAAAVHVEEIKLNKSVAFLGEIDALQKREIPENVIKRARRSLLDYLAVASAGAAFQREKMERYMAFAQPEAGEFTAIGLGKRLALKEAVFLNGLNGHALDFDDGTNSGIIHLGSPIFSLLLPLAERYDTDLDALLHAAVIGYETSYTMAVSIQPGHKALGYHATGTCGVLGATVAASYMLGLTEEERLDAFGAACVSASGMLKALDGGSELKPYNVAKAALLALTSLQLAKAGFKGDRDPLGGRGFLKMMTGKEDVELDHTLQNGGYAIMKTYTKPYASCRYTHPAVEAAIRMGKNVRPEDVERIDIRTYSLAVSGHDHTEIPGEYSAKMSTPYATAAAMIFGKAGLQEFSRNAVNDPEVLALTRRVRVQADPVLSEAFPAVQAAVVSITKKDGAVLTQRVDYPKGEPENPLSEAEFRERYDGLMAYAGVEPAVSGEVYDAVGKGNAGIREILAGL